jgi:hypothetical protein
VQSLFIGGFQWPDLALKPVFEADFFRKSVEDSIERHNVCPKILGILYKPPRQGKAQCNFGKESDPTIPGR